VGFLDRLRGKVQTNTLEELDNRPLLNAMEDLARQDSRESRALLYRTLLDAILIVPTPELPPNLKTGPFVATGNEAFHFPLLRDSRGTRLVPVFSDLGALRNWDPNTPYIGLNAVALFKTVLGTEAEEIRINPFDPLRKMIRPGGTLTRREFQLLSEGRIPSESPSGMERIAFQPGQQILIGIPAKEPAPEVLDALVSTARSIDRINSLYLFQLGWQQDRNWKFQRLIGVQLIDDSDLQKEEVIRKLAQSIQPLIPADEFLDFMVLQGTLEHQVMTSGKLLYEIAA
jgi:hypothetical protein